MIKAAKDEITDLTSTLAPLAAITLFAVGPMGFFNFNFLIALKLLLGAGACAVLYLCTAPKPGSREEQRTYFYGGLSLGVWIICFLGMAGEALGQGSPLQAFRFLFEVTLLISTAWLLNRYRLGWFTDERGERQRVLGRDRFGAIISPTTHTLRRNEAFLSRRKRLAIMALCGAPSLVLGMAAYSAYGADPGVAYLLGGLAALPALAFACLLGIEAVYQFGFQHMPGAKVRDPQPLPPGLDAVRTQKAHGDARLATPDEALALLNRKG